MNAPTLIVAGLVIAVVAMIKYRDDIMKMWKSTRSPASATTTTTPGATPVATTPKPKGREWDPFLTGSWLTYWVVVVFAVWWVFPVWFWWFVNNTGYTIIGLGILLFACGSYFLTYEKDHLKIGRSRFWKVAFATGLLMFIITPVANANGMGQTDPATAFQNLPLPTLARQVKAEQPKPDKVFELTAPAGGWSASFEEVRGKAPEKAISTCTSWNLMPTAGETVQFKTNKGKTGKIDSTPGRGPGSLLWSDLPGLRFQSTSGKEVTVKLTLHYD